MAFENRKYVIVPTSEVGNIDFSEVLETAPETCRYSVDGTQTFVKYEGTMPESVAVITGKSQEYSHSEIFTILATSDWVAPEEEL